MKDKKLTLCKERKQEIKIHGKLPVKLRKYRSKMDIFKNDEIEKATNTI